MEKSASKVQPNTTDKDPASPERREFMGASAIAAGAGAALVAGAGANVASAQEASKLDWRSATPGRADGAMYTEQTGFLNTDDVKAWNGRGIMGVAVGVIQINTYAGALPMVPGNMGNGTTYNFPLLWRPMDYENIVDVMAPEPVEGFTNAAVEACKWLELQGVRAITTNCGFFGTYQKVIQGQIDTPFFGSSLLQLPMMLRSMPKNKKVGVVTAHAANLLASSAIENCGLSAEDKAERLVVTGLEDDPEFAFLLKLAGEFNMDRMGQAVVRAARQAVQMDENVGAILLECTELPPHAHQVSDAVRMPVWDYTTMVNYMYAGCVRQPFTGFI